MHQPENTNDSPLPANLAFVVHSDRFSAAGALSCIDQLNPHPISNRSARDIEFFDGIPTAATAETLSL